MEGFRAWQKPDEYEGKLETRGMEEQLELDRFIEGISMDDIDFDELIE